MPHIRRRPVEYAPPPPPEAVQDPNTPVFLIDFTGEIFLTYDEYYARISLYRRKIWACETTGRIGMTFVEALESERTAKVKIGQRFPRVWNRPALERIHFNQLTLNELIDDVYEFFRVHHYPGEIIHYSATNDRTSFVKAELLEELPPRPVGTRSSISAADMAETSDAAIDADGSDGPDPLVADDSPAPVASAASLAQAKGNAQDKRRSERMFRIRTLTTPEEVLDVPIFRIRRDRLALSKQTIKKYIREVAAKDTWIGAPWYVKPELVKKYGLPESPPEELQQILDRRNGKLVPDKPKVDQRKKLMGTSDGRRDAPVSFPIDDTYLFEPRFQRGPAASANAVGDEGGEGAAAAGTIGRPMPSFDFGAIPPTHVLRLITIWNFATIYSEMLNIAPFTFAELCESLEFSGPGSPPTLLEELFSGITWFACREWSRGFDPMTGMHPQIKPLPEIAGVSPEAPVAASDETAAGAVAAVSNGKTPLKVEDDDGTQSVKAAEEKHENEHDERQAPSEMDESMQVDAVQRMHAVAKPRLQLEDVNPVVLTALRAYFDLTEDERVAVDQWYGWYPGKWAREPAAQQQPSPHKRVRTSRTGSAPVADLPRQRANDRLRAWEVALAGLIKDVLDAEVRPGSTDAESGLKWRLLAMLLAGHGSAPSSPARESSARNDDMDEGDNASAGASVMLGDENGDENGDGDYDDGENEDGDGDDVDGEGDGDEDDSDGDNEDEGSVDEIVSFRGRTSGSSRKRSKIDDSDEDDWAPAQTTRTTRSARSLRSGTPPARPVVTASGRQSRSAPTFAAEQSVATTATTSRGVRNLDVGDESFDRLCRAARAGFSSISAADRVALLALIIDECLAGSEELRQRRERAIDLAIELRKERREIARERKRLTVQMLEFDQPGASGNGDEVDNDGSDGESGSDSDDEAVSRHMSRVQKLRIEQQKREMEERRRQDELQRQREQSKELRAKIDERRKLEERDRQLQRRARIIDHLLRIEYAAVRLRPLGRDRFHNRYWWFDGGFGAYPFDAVTQGIDASGRAAKGTPAPEPEPEAGRLEYSSGRLFVEEFGLDEEAMRLISGDGAIGDGSGSGAGGDGDEGDGAAVVVYKQPPLNEREDVRRARLGLVEGRWGYYSTPEQIGQLVTWLDARGVRELGLLSNLGAVRELTDNAMLGGLFVAALAAVAASAQVSPSTPEVGQTTRYRAAPRGSLLSVVPVDGAEFIANQHFDISIELHNVASTVAPDLSGLQATINGQPLEQFFSKKFASAEAWNFTYFADSPSRDAKKSTNVAAARLALRSVKLAKVGDYKLSLKAGNQSVDATWTVRKIGGRKTKNLVLFIADGTSPAMISAARYLSRATKFGKFGSNFLEIEKLGTIGKIATNGIDAIITDSANSAAAYLTGQKGWVNGLNVYSDTSADTLDDPKVETLAEYIRNNRPGMCVGVVTTAGIHDATPAAVYAHTRRRGDLNIITDQLINPFNHNNISWDPKPVAPEVIFGGGGATFCPKSSGTVCSSTVDYYALFKSQGYNVVKSKTELEAADSTNPILGIFSAKHMDTWYDRALHKDNLKVNPNSHPDGKGSAVDQPGLELMTKHAIEVLSNSKRCSDGFFLMSEAAAVDKAMHPMDYDRGLADLLELDRTVKATKEWAQAHGDNTGIIVTADHSQAFDVYGSVDTQYLNSLPNDDSSVLGTDTAGLQVLKHLAIGEYENSGWIDLVTDETGMPTKWNGRYRLASGKADGLNVEENWQIRDVPANVNPLSRNGVVADSALTAKFGIGSIYRADPNEPHGVRRAPLNPLTDETSVHSLNAVDIYCYGPWNWRLHCAKVMDNTELFFVMAEALGLGNDKC
ncbi:hypothetical protein HK105_201971 [Polyrhizophydium stewartii]|uniref:alkaline phosphatase n=1 Tax=Polyrhizophydium stewartii TaxID=2732419 RepID=A0ABR4NGH9_9FUNG